MKIVGVSFKENGKIYYFNINNVNVEKGLKVIVETEKGLQLGEIVTKIKEIDSKDMEKYQDVKRIASKEDILQAENNIISAGQAMKKATKFAKDLGLEMTFIDTVYTFDKNQLLFYFVADNRVDFRELAKQLASQYKTRIELRQVGVRDKAKEVSGMGTCGRKLCCSSFLKDLDSVSITMAKNQNLALNPSKINGLCGRLLCCLNFEDDMYTENKKELPSLGEKIKTKTGNGTVYFIDIPNMKYKVNLEDGTKIEINIPTGCDYCEKQKECSK